MPDLKDTTFDIFVGASGYEKRATHIAQNLDLSSIKSKFVFTFTDRQNHQRSDNDLIFSRLNVVFIEASGDEGDTLAYTIKCAIESLNQSCVRIFVDYSSMTRSWYAAIIA